MHTFKLSCELKKNDFECMNFLINHRIFFLFFNIYKKTFLGLEKSSSQKVPTF